VRFALRAYRPEDFQTLWEIDQSCFTPEIAYSQFELRFYVRRPQAFTIVAEEIAAADGAQSESPLSQSNPSSILGFLVGDITPRGWGHIITIDVRERGRRHGIGSALLGAAETRFQRKNCPAIRLETAVNNIGALHFYKRHGYDVVRTVPHYYSDGLDALLLEKVLVKSSARHLH
jgi:ribosomal protein S18 acetylase RimI-like enzyme